MNSPLVLFERRLPRELIFMIQRYISNDFVHDALSEYKSYLIYEQKIYDEFCYNQYVLPNCYCHRLSQKYLKKYDGCDHCRTYESLYYYKLPQYLTCIMDDNDYAIEDLNYSR
jgi:hypothetical protein